MRRLSVIGVAAATLAVAVIVAGCADSRSILYSGVSGGLSASPPQVVTDTAAVRAGRSVRAFWLSNLASGKLGPAGNVSQRQFRSRLAGAASHYGFTVERVRFVRTRGQIAPLVIIETEDTSPSLARFPLSLGHSTR